MSILAPLEQLYHSFIAVFPTILTVLAVVIIGLIAARIIGRVVQTLCERLGVETLLERLGAPKLLYRVGYKKRTTVLLGGMVRWIVYLITVVIAADLAGLGPVSRGLDVVVGYLPRLAVAIVFLMVGVWAADMIRGVVSNVAKGNQGDMIGTVIYYAIVAITVALVADQLGLQTALINHIIVLVIAGAIFAAALAAGLSARSVLSNMFARNYVVQLYPRGDTVRIDGIEGIVKGHSPTALVIRGDTETYNVPYVRFMTAAVATSGEPRPVGPDTEAEEDETDRDEDVDAE